MAARKGRTMQLGNEQLLQKRCAGKTYVGLRWEAVGAIHQGGVAIPARHGRSILRPGKAGGPASRGNEEVDESGRPHGKKGEVR